MKSTNSGRQGFSSLESLSSRLRRMEALLSTTQDICGQFPEVRVTEAGYDCYDWVEFNLGSPPQRIEKLLELGWQPVNLTKAGNPKVDEDELLAYAEDRAT
jgi:hypothetical protein